MRSVLLVLLALGGLVSCSSQRDVTQGSAAADTTMRPLDFCGNSIDEDGDGTDRTCTASDDPGPRSTTVLRGTADLPDGTSYDVEMDFVPDGDPACPNPPSSWPSVEGCAGKPSCSIQLAAKVKVTNPATSAVVTEYTLGPHQCHGGTSVATSVFTYNAQENKILYSGIAGVGTRVTLRNNGAQQMFGSGSVNGQNLSFILEFVGSY